MILDYMIKYDISKDEIFELENLFNENIINFLNENEDFIEEKLDYLKKNKYIIYPIIKNNLKVFLENFNVLEEKIEKLEKLGYTHKSIQIILISQELYDKF